MVSSLPTSLALDEYPFSISSVKVWLPTDSPLGYWKDGSGPATFHSVHLILWETLVSWPCQTVGCGYSINPSGLLSPSGSPYSCLQACEDKGQPLKTTMLASPCRDYLGSLPFFCGCNKIPWPRATWRGKG